MKNYIQNYLKNELANWNKLEISWFIFAILFILATLFFRQEQNLIAIFAAIFGVSAAVFTGQGKLSGFILGSINSILYAIISYNYNYFGEVIVKIFVFLPLNVYGIYAWNKHISVISHEAIKRELKLKKFMLVLLIIAISIAIFAYILQLMNNSLPIIDSASSILAVFALILCINRYAEHWLIWIIINILNIVLWIAPFLDGRGKPIAILAMWIFYLINSIIMYIRWKKDVNKNAI